MIIRKLRLQHGWSQEELAAMTGLNVRTIQRAEKGHRMSLETKRSLAAVFEVSKNSLQQEELTMTNLPENTPKQDETFDNAALIDQEEKDAFEFAKGLKAMLSHATVFIVIGVLMFSQIEDRPNLATILMIWSAMMVAHTLYALDAFGLQRLVVRKRREGLFCNTKFEQRFLKASSAEERLAILRARRLKSWYENIAVFIFFVVFWIVNGDLLPLSYDNWLFAWVSLWAAVVLIHGLIAFGVIRIFGAEWERDIIEKRLGRKL